MPFVIQKTDQCPVSRPYGVLTETSHGSGKTKGKPHGCFPSEEAAREQQKALYSAVPEAKSVAPAPPLLRDAIPGSTECCATCKMFDDGVCWGYGNYPVAPDLVCNSYSPEPATSEIKSESGTSEVPMTATASPAQLPNLIEWRRERAHALSESQRKRTETRQVHEPLELRAGSTEGKRLLRSYASLFDTPYSVRTIGHHFEEVVRPGAFKRTLGRSPDVVFRTEHSGPPLAATWSNDLRLGEDERGLWYEVDLDESDPDVQSLISKVERGVYRDSSFGFRIGHNGDKWNDERDHRELTACELDRGDVSVVTFGASRETGRHLLLRSEEAIKALQDLGFERFVAAWVEWRDVTSLPPAERAGKIISSTSMETLRSVLGLIADADDAVDQAEAMLADFIGIPNPDDDDEHEENEPGKMRKEEGSTEKREASPLSSDRDRTAPHLMDTMLGDLAHAYQHCERLFESEVITNLGSVKFNADHLKNHVDSAQEHARKLDDHLSQFSSNPTVFRSERERLTAQRAEEAAELKRELEAGDFWSVVGDLAEESGWTIREDGSIIHYHLDDGEDEYWLREDSLPEQLRADLSAAGRAKMAKEGTAMKDGSYPIPSLPYLKRAIRAFGRAKNKPAVKAWIKRRAKALGATNLIPETWRIEGPVQLADNDTEDLRVALRLQG